MSTNGKTKGNGHGKTGTATGKPERPTALSPTIGLMGSEGIRRAFAIAVPAAWQKEDDFRVADQAAAIGAALVREIHPHLVNARIGYLFREKMAERDRIPLAKVSKVSGKLQFYAELDFLIEVNWTQWYLMPREKRVAVIDHELCHCSVEFSEKGEQSYVLLGHDVEEFTAIVQRWGQWKPDLERFFKAGVKQGELFPGMPIGTQPSAPQHVVQ